MELTGKVIEFAPVKSVAVNPIDKHVGARLRSRRLLLGIEHASLAEMIGATLHEVQKHEAGEIRIHAERLFHITRALNVTASYFFEGLTAGGSVMRLLPDELKHNL
jgi:transcriptional regulator with XRE-family HTH domain